MEWGVKGLGRGKETGGVSGLKVPCALAAGDDGGRARGGVRRGEGDLSERGLPSSSGGSGCIPRFGGGGDAWIPIWLLDELLDEMEAARAGSFNFFD